MMVLQPTSLKRISRAKLSRPIGRLASETPIFKVVGAAHIQSIFSNKVYHHPIWESVPFKKPKTIMIFKALVP